MPRMTSALFPKSGSIAIGSSTTDPVVMNQMTLCGIITGSTLSASTLSFLVSNDGDTYYPLFGTSGSEITISASPMARGYALETGNYFPWQFVKLREGTSASAVLQASNNADVTFLLRSL